MTSTDDLSAERKYVVRSVCYGYAENRLRIHIPHGVYVHLYEQAFNLSEAPKRLWRMNHYFDDNLFKDSTCVATYSGHMLLGGQLVKPYVNYEER